MQAHKPPKGKQRLPIGIFSTSRLRILKASAKQPAATRTHNTQDILQPLINLPSCRSHAAGSCPVKLMVVWINKKAGGNPKWSGIIKDLIRARRKLVGAAASSGSSLSSSSPRCISLLCGGHTFSASFWKSAWRRRVLGVLATRCPVEAEPLEACALEAFELDAGRGELELGGVANSLCLPSASFAGTFANAGSGTASASAPAAKAPASDKRRCFGIVGGGASARRLRHLLVAEPGS